jgi:Phospholipase_D-nuclease N-terminal
MSYVVLLLGVGVTIYALVDCWRSTDDEVRGLPRPAWILLILLFPPLGAVAYLPFGRQAAFPSQGRVIAPDDDPEFLRKLDLDRRRAAAEDRRREQRERKERDRQQRKEKDQRTGDPNSTGPESDGHTGRP